MILRSAYRIILSALFCLVLLPVCEAHKANEAFFRFLEKDSTLTVFAEFPWSIRHALLNLDDSLDEQSNTDDFTRALYNYFKKSFSVYKLDGDALNILSFRILPQQGHNHQLNFEIIYSGNSVSSVKNSLFTDQLKGQTNYHLIESTGRIYTTNFNKEYFDIRDRPRKNKTSKITLFVILIAAALGGVLIIKY